MGPIGRAPVVCNASKIPAVFGSCRANHRQYDKTKYGAGITLHAYIDCHFQIKRIGCGRDGPDTPPLAGRWKNRKDFSVHNRGNLAVVSYAGTAHHCFQLIKIEFGIMSDHQSWTR